MIYFHNCLDAIKAAYGTGAPAVVAWQRGNGFFQYCPINPPAGEFDKVFLMTGSRNLPPLPLGESGKEILPAWLAQIADKANQYIL